MPSGFFALLDDIGALVKASAASLDEEVYLDEKGKKQKRNFVVDTDEGPRADTSMEVLAKLKPAFAANGVVTAGNSSQTSDGAAFVIVMSERLVNQLGLKPIGRLVACASAGVHPRIMGIGPVAAIPKVLKQANMNLGDIDLVELNEAFASQAIAVIEQAGLNAETVNINGGAIALKNILVHLQLRNKAFEVQKPILLKIAPDLTLPQIDDVVELAKEIDLDGLVVSNTTISRENLDTSETELKKVGAGGLSGKPLQQRSTELVEYIYKQKAGTIPVIGSGGIFNGEDAQRKLSAGASLIEVWTGFIYEGPFIVRNICKHLKKKMENRKWRDRKGQAKTYIIKNCPRFNPTSN